MGNRIVYTTQHTIRTHTRTNPCIEFVVCSFFSTPFHHWLFGCKIATCNKRCLTRYEARRAPNIHTRASLSYQQLLPLSTQTPQCSQFVKITKTNSRPSKLEIGKKSKDPKLFERACVSVLFSRLILIVNLKTWKIFSFGGKWFAEENHNNPKTETHNNFNSQG